MTGPVPQEQPESKPTLEQWDAEVRRLQQEGIPVRLQDGQVINRPLSGPEAWDLVLQRWGDRPGAIERTMEKLHASARVEALQGCCPGCEGRQGMPYTPHYLVWHDKQGHPDLWATTGWLPTSDLYAVAVLQMMCAEAGSPVMCGYQTGRWFVFDGTVYAAQDGLFATRMMQWLAASYGQVLSEIENSIRQRVILNLGIETARSEIDKATAKELACWKPHRSYLARICSEHGQAALARQAGRTCGIDEDHLDTEPGEIIVDGGRISYDQILRDGYVTVLPPDPSRLVTKRMGAGAVYDPAATCPVFDAMMATSVADTGQRDWLLWRTINALFGRMPRKGFVNPIGERDSGKSTFAEIMHRLGGSYVKTVPIQTFLVKGSGDSGFREAELRAARMVIAQEPKPGGRYDDGFMKDITGRDRQRTAGKWEKTTEWKPQCTPFIGSNAPIRFASSDEAFLERHEPVRFARGYREKDEALGAKLEAELPGILNRLLGYAVREARWGPPPLPASMAAEREKLVSETENALAFVAEQIENGVLAEVPDLPVSRYAQVTWLFNRYRDWCAAEEGVSPQQQLGRKDFRGVVGRKYKVEKSNGYRFTGLWAAGTT